MDDVIAGRNFLWARDAKQEDELFMNLCTQLAFYTSRVDKTEINTLLFYTKIFLKVSLNKNYNRST